MRRDELRVIGDEIYVDGVVVARMTKDGPKQLQQDLSDLLNDIGGYQVPMDCAWRW